MSVAARILAVLIIALLLLGPCRSELERDNPYRVYSDLLREAISESEEKPDYMVVVSKNVKHGMRQDSILDLDIPGLRQDTIESFVAENRRDATTLRDAFSNDLNIRLIEEERIEDIFDSGARDGWDQFYEEFPESTGILYLSRVGFSEDGRQALVYIQNSRHRLAGSGRLVVLRWEDKRWRIESSKTLWIS